ncbi:uncharacterized protein LOC134274166 [Saccostrea cucullata]|uniref:uncharacterized protein LOC134274166 n=1 Tax=Saccostrea cuccullata TaxID=36930 RepID=UPI002ED2EA9D
MRALGPMVCDIPVPHVAMITVILVPRHSRHGYDGIKYCRGAKRPARARRLRRQVPASAGSVDLAAQQDALEAEQVAQQDASDTLQPQLVAAVTEQVLKAIREQSAGGQSGEERGRERQRSSRGRKRRRRSSSGSMLDSSSDGDKSDNDSEDSSSSEESDSDDEQQLLSSPISSQVDS